MARWVRMASLSLVGTGDPKRNLESAVNLIDEALWDHPDLICLPETFTGLGCCQKEWLKTAEPLDGPTVCAVRERARRGDCWIVCPILLDNDGAITNSSIVINRSGEVAGRYDKMFPTIGELESGIRPGESAPVLDTDFGRLGCAICFDLNFYEVACSLKQNGAELVCFSSMYPGGRQVQYWALEYQFWMVTAIASPQSVIVNPLGRILASAQPHYQPIVSATVNLDAVVLHLDYNYEKVKKLKEKYGADAEWEIAQPEGRSLLICNKADATVWDWVDEFGLEVISDYWARARSCRSFHIATETKPTV